MVQKADLILKEEENGYHSENKKVRFRDHGSLNAPVDKKQLFETIQARLQKQTNKIRAVMLTKIFIVG